MRSFGIGQIFKQKIGLNS